jgi:hypothetical protein
MDAACIDTRSRRDHDYLDHHSRLTVPGPPTRPSSNTRQQHAFTDPHQSQGSNNRLLPAKHTLPASQRAPHPLSIAPPPTSRELTPRPAHCPTSPLHHSRASGRLRKNEISRRLSYREPQDEFAKETYRDGCMSRPSPRWLLSKGQELTEASFQLHRS